MTLAIAGGKLQRSRNKGAWVEGQQGTEDGMDRRDGKGREGKERVEV